MAEDARKCKSRAGGAVRDPGKAPEPTKAVAFFETWEGTKAVVTHFGSLECASRGWQNGAITHIAMVLGHKRR